MAAVVVTVGAGLPKSCVFRCFDENGTLCFFVLFFHDSL